MTAIPVIATRQGRLWRLTYRDKCVDCGKRHFHGGGTDPEPYLGDGWWMTHCVKPGVPEMVRLTLVPS